MIAMVLCAALVAPVQGAPTRAPQSLSGTWNMSLQGDHVIPVGLVLHQEGAKVTGTMMIMQNDVALEGEFVGSRLALTSNAAFVMGRHGDRADASAAPAKMSLTATLKEDGTLAGEVTTTRGPLPMTAERLRERPATKAGAPAARAAAASLTGAWKMTVEHGSMAFDLEFQQDGNKVKGAIDSEHSGRLPFDGTFVGNTLTFATDQGAPPATMHLECSATLTDQGTLAGHLSGPMGRMAWTAERVKK